MEKIYSHLDFARVGHFEALLKDSGIACFVKNQNASSVMGEIPYLEVWPEIWVYDAAEAERAKAILDEFEHGEARPIPAWTCAHCGTDVEAGFSECWNCGKAHPAFVS